MLVRSEVKNTIEKKGIRLRVEEEIFAKDEWERTFDAVPDLIAILDDQYRIVKLNRAMAERLSMSKEEAVGMTCYSCVHGLNEPPDYCPYTQLLADGKEHQKETYEDCLGGDFLTSVSPLRDNDGRLIGSVHIARDITILKQAERAVRESEERFKTLAEKAPFGIAIMKRDGVFEYLNPKFNEIFGYSLEEIWDRETSYEMACLEKDHGEKVISLRRQDKQENPYSHGPEPREFTVKCKDGRNKVISCRSVILSDGKKIFTYEDITETKKMEAQLQHSQKMESIGTIAGGVAHNFRNILAIISLNNQLMQMDFQDKPKLQTLTERTRDAVERGSQLVKGLLQFARKPVASKFENIDLAEVIRKTYQHISRSFDKKINIRIEIPESLPIVGDRSGLGEVFMNLCANAKDAMPEGGELFIKALKQGDCAEVIISDTGFGMDSKTLENCFDPFFTTKEVNKGTGLGLSTSYGIIVEHGGDIQLESEPNKGTTFRIFLPLEFPVESTTSKERGEIVSGKGEKILVVDDEATFLQSVEELLTAIGYRVESVSTASAAISKYRSWRPDAVLLDRKMPEMDGVSCAKTILSEDPEARIVILSGYNMEGPDGIDNTIMGAISGYLTKPVVIEELSGTLAQVLNKNGSS